MINLQNLDLHVTSPLTKTEGMERISSYPGWIKFPHVVNLGIQKISDLDSLTIFIGGGEWGGGVFQSKLWSSQI